jgi:hypothetical protein
MRPVTIADIDATIAHWDRTGVDYCDAWWALGQRDVCWHGWPQVRKHMIEMAVAQAVPLRRAA